MANEFVARKGIVSLGNIQVTGSISATGGITITGSIASASFAATASSADNFFVRQNLTGSNILASGNITAQTLVVQTVTSSIVYSSGSNIFGNQLTDIQQFTGSFRVTGSTTLNGNAAIGLNPSSATIRTLEINSSGNGLASNTTSQILLTGNAYYGSGGWTYGSTAAASYYQQNLGAHSWFIAPSGTAGAVTNFTQSMTLDSSGKLGIGTSSPNAKLEVFGGSAISTIANSYTNAGYLHQYNSSNLLSIGSDGTSMILQAANATNNTAKNILLNPLGGCVGIGTASPSGKLDVSQDQNSTSTGTFTSPHIRLSATNTTDTTGFTGIAYSTSTLTNYGFTAGAQRIGTLGSDAAFIWRYHNNSATGTEYMRITSDGIVSINCNGSFGKGAKLQILQGSSNTNALDFKNTDATYGHIGTFANNLYLTQNYYYAGGQNNDSATYGQAAITMGVSNVAGDTSIDFSMSDPGATSPNSKMRLFSVGCGVLLVGTTTCTAEASLVLGAKGTVEGGQLVLQKGTSCSCATHLDNYQNTFRIMSGTDTASSTVNVLVDHVQRFLAVGRTIPFSVFGDSNGIVQYGDGSIYAAASNTEALGLSRIGTDGAVAIFRRSTTTVGSICVTASATSFNTSSDYRLKTDLKSFNGVCLIARIKPYDFKWKVNCDRMYGFIAHELAEVLPYVVSGEKDGEEMQSLDYSKLTPVLVKAIQEQQCQICTQSIIIDQLKTCLGII